MTPKRPLVQEGAQFSPMHPNRYVSAEKQLLLCRHPALVKLSNGDILLPFYLAPLDKDGKYHNPVGAFTFSWVACLIGRWNEAGNDVTWDVSEDVRLSGEQSSRGSNECAVMELKKPGHVLLIVRASNEPDPRGNLPAWKWKALSTDYGRTWTAPTPLAYDDGEEFWSPSSCSSMIRSSRTGKVYWIGNISRTFPRGNAPRYPLVMAEVDEDGLTLRKDTVTIVDDQPPGDPADLQLSNLSLLEDQATGHIIVHIDRYMSQTTENGGAHTYVIEVK